jgi:serine/threonine protein kinase
MPVYACSLFDFIFQGEVDLSVQPNLASSLALSIAKGMTEIHHHGIVHFDLKPGKYMR